MDSVGKTMSTPLGRAGKNLEVTATESGAEDSGKSVKTLLVCKS